ncbi:hypothetical protein SRB5_52210 [Streptomyces sp. RB5]|uniref:Uncharacterized protein n=1 Tax=Streptomyces smaragdinus TaxID=2585196 RepID=A0A7K0CQL2_9ACTN|nr:hypothetical protein [Streptomyces smaragdinus]MQY15044.1 hypothetical protein [Streptomyces smaragdinus]
MRHPIHPQGSGDEPRLLPWLSPEGKRCFLITGEGGGLLSRLADVTEAELLSVGADILGEAMEILDDPLSDYTEVRYTGRRLARSLRDVLRVAEARGMRLS